MTQDYRKIGDTIEFAKIVVTKNRFVVPIKSRDDDGREGEIMSDGTEGYMRVGGVWKKIT